MKTTHTSIGESQPAIQRLGVTAELPERSEESLRDTLKVAWSTTTPQPITSAVGT